MQDSSAMLSKGPLVELNEKIILERMDTKKTYYNSILSSMKPKFKYRPRLRENQAGTEGNSLRDFSTGDLNYGADTPKRAKSR
jgi:hypothetical protein